VVVVVVVVVVVLISKLYEAVEV